MRARWPVILSSMLLSACASPDHSSRETADASWLAKAQDRISEREYRASENGEGLQAPNRAHNLRTWFEPTGIRVHDRTAGSAELLRLLLAGVGRGEDLVAVRPGEEVAADENRVEIRRPGLVEWYVNSSQGLEQGFTLAERPKGDGPLVVELTVAGARPALRGDAIVFETGAQRKLSYGKLAAADATGHMLVSRFELPDAQRLRIVVDDAGATYPLVIDPLLTETADTQLESNQTDALFGVSVAGAGDVNGDGYADVIVGAHLYDAGQTDEGAVFVFHGSASGIADGTPATAAAQLESDQANAQLGLSVAGAGDVNGDGYADVIVGAYLYDADQTDEGAAFIFLGSAAGIADGNPATAAAQLESDQADAHLGISVAGAGDVNGDGYVDVIVGADAYDAGETDEGAAFVFLGSAAGIADGNPASATAQLESNQAGARLGFSVAGAGDVNGNGYADVIVGAYLYTAGQGSEGAAFVFSGSASGVADGTPATAAAQLESDQVGAYLGYSVASAGDVNGDGYADVIVGARFYDAGESNEGAAFVFMGGLGGIASGNPSAAAAQLQANQAGADFGYSVSGAGDVNGDGYADVLVGAPAYSAGESAEGSVLLFFGSAAGIVSGTRTTAGARLDGNQVDAELGSSVASAGDVNGDGYADVVVGAPQFDAGQGDEGVAFVFLGGSWGVAGDGTPMTAAAPFQSNQADAQLGGSVASAGDVNGDGYADVIVGAPGYDAGETDEGAAFVFLGRVVIGFGFPLNAAAQLESDQAGAVLGSVAGAGDVNGDGYADVIVGAYNYDAGETDEGAAFVFLGSASGIADGNPTTAAAQLESNQASARLGFGVAGAGDVNSDGYADVAVNAVFYDNGQTDEGAVFVFHGSASGIADGNPATAPTQLESDQASAAFAYSLASAGDVNADGYADLIVGSPFYDASQTNEGAAFVFHGSATGIADGNPITAAAQLESNQADAWLGYSVAGAGDVNGDGYADVIVGSHPYDDGETGEGAAFVFHGGASGIGDGNPATAAAQLESDQTNAFLGWSVAGAGEVNGDGYADVIVGAQNYDAGETDEGAAFVFHGSASGIADGNPATAAVQLESDQAFAELGSSVAGAGDVNGDGYADVIVGASDYDAGQTDEGAAFVFLGTGDPHPLLPRQRRGNGSGIPVQAWGGSYSATGFVAELLASHPAGAGRVKAEVEACVTGVAFGDPGCTTETSSSWVAVNGTTPAAVVSRAFTGLSPSTLYRWRARVLHAPSTGTIPAEPAHGPWRRLGGQSVEADVRTMPEPGLLVSFASGMALVAALARRRR